MNDGGRDLSLSLVVIHAEARERRDMFDGPVTVSFVPPVEIRCGRHIGSDQVHRGRLRSDCCARGATNFRFTFAFCFLRLM